MYVTCRQIPLVTIIMSVPVLVPGNDTALEANVASSIVSLDAFILYIISHRDKANPSNDMYTLQAYSV